MCVCCGKSGHPSGRGLRTSCHRRHTRAGTLIDFPCQKWWSSDAQLDLYRRRVTGAPLGISRAHIAKDIGMSVKALDKMLQRARQRGDERAVRLPRADPMAYRQFREQYPI